MNTIRLDFILIFLNLILLTIIVLDIQLDIIMRSNQPSYCSEIQSISFGLISRHSISQDNILYFLVDNFPRGEFFENG